MMQTLVIDGRLPSLNEYINACRVNRYAGASMKKKCQDAILWEIRRQIKADIDTPVVITFKWYEPNRKRDLDNICFAKKFILDALQESGRLENDNWRHVEGFSDEFYIDAERPRIEAIIRPVKEMQNGK